MSVPSMLSTVPTWPMSTPFLSGVLMKSFLAFMKWPSLPVKPTALPPNWFNIDTISLFTEPPNTISTTSMVSASVTRMPCTNSPCLPTFSNMWLICGPPPCTTMGFIPHSFNNTTSLAKPSFKAASVMALPPYLITIVAPAYLRM